MYKHALRVLAMTIIALVPLDADATVRINEIAWMGTDEGGANCEWIELANTDSSIVDLSGWSISITNTGNTTSKILNLGEAASVKYSGIAGSGYYVVARNSGNCGSLAPGKDADWLGSFGNGISNTGATLQLLHGTEVVDSVNADAGWTISGGIGGKNPSGGTKETPQYTGGIWITAVPTPRSMNAAIPVETIPEPVEDTSSSTPPMVTIGGTTPTTPAASPIIKIYVDAGDDRIVSVGADAPYEAIVYDAAGKLHPNAEVTWSFGDGQQHSGASVMNTYYEEGEYLVVVRAREKNQSAIATLSVVATPAHVSIGDASDRGLTLTNEGDQLVDLSGWKLSTGRKHFTLPPDTALRAHSSVFLSAIVTHLSTTTTPTLAYPDGTKVFAYVPPSVQPHVPEVSIEEEQEVVPVESVPVAHLPLPEYVEEVDAPTAEVEPAAVGAAVPPSGNVILKDDGMHSFFGDLLDSLASFIVR